jgi:1-acyl-sn-glycerol-3-phosphate acyltransferase
LRPQRAERPGFLAGAASFLRHRLSGEYQVDEFGFDPELTDVLMPPLRAVYDKWFRVEVTGSLPAGTGALVVANHSGTLPWDALMTSIAVHDNHPEGRHLRMLGADLVFRLPVLASLARKTGTTLACSADAQRLLAAGEVVGVWPEGFKGIGKPFRDRYRLQRFGRGGFVVSALRAGVPIIPCSIVGAEEIYPKIADIRPLARLLGLPYFPVTPLFPVLGPLGAIPLPTKWTIDFGEPIRTDRAAPDADQDHGFVLEIADHVRETIQANLNRMVAARDSVFRG